MAVANPTSSRRIRARGRSRRRPLMTCVSLSALVVVVVFFPIIVASLSPITSTPQPIAEILNLSLKAAVKIPGSESHRRAWNRWSVEAISHVRHRLSSTLDPVSSQDIDALEDLSHNLGLAADLGEMPSFGHGGARAGYALGYFCRVRLLADVLFMVHTEKARLAFLSSNENEEPGFGGRTDEDAVAAAAAVAGANDESFLGTAIDDLLCSGTKDVCKIGSLGGGPGFDHVAAVLLSTHGALERRGRTLRKDDFEKHYREGFKFSEVSTGCHDGHEELESQLKLTLEGGTNVVSTVYEYEHGWGEIVPHMERATQSTLGGGHTCDFAGCDITLPLTHDTNARCLAEADSTDLWICSYCVAENAVRLRDADFVFFVQLFERAAEGALFVFTETTHRLWPELIDVALANTDGGGAEGIDVAFPRLDRGRGKSGFQLAIRKRKGATLGKEVGEMCDRFRRDNGMHERKIAGGWVRQKKKVRGAK